MRKGWYCVALAGLALAGCTTARPVPAPPHAALAHASVSNQKAFPSPDAQPVAETTP